MKIGLKGKRALVLGASKGLGFGIAKGLAEEGAVVAIASRSLESASAAGAKIGAKGFACDTGKLDQIEALHVAVTKELGGVDVLVLNSGGPPPGGAQNVSSAQWRTSFEGMFVGLVRLADLVLPGMIERKWGRIISVISSGVIEPIPNLAISNAIRPALVGWGKSLANEVARHGITVNAVAPGRIATDRLLQLDKANAEKQGKSIAEIEAAAKARIPAGRYGTVEDYAAVAVFLASEAAGYVTGSILRADGGQIASH
ncbi:MAG: SDR family oxidoreductase [Hyphomicrobiales bacterium]|nr:SDR family oxidoreductase [Hyphomicrobiales bacterium]MBV9137920.1 SDR family oxidoreductase [Hyphomicrobiales bacterium]MBV9589919.1 SDR family oxidoreductase [Hyphomicrobiales bacterium]MBV9752361.1 SDR family oxidoreductase [Hyphomicrobiales bacterium]